MSDWENAVSHVVAGEGITVDATNPRRPIVSASGGGGGGVQSISGGLSVTVDDTDPANPVISLGGDYESFPHITPGMGEGDDPNIYIGVSEATHVFIADAEGIEIGTDQGVTVTATGNVAIQSTDGDTRFDLSGGGNSLSLQGAPGEYLNLTAAFGVNIYTSKPLTIHSPVPMILPAAANVPGTLDPTLYGGGMIYDSALHIMLWSDGTAWWEFGKVVSVGAGDGIAVDSTDPANPIVSVAAPEVPE